jgi:hypothetical protein
MPSAHVINTTGHILGFVFLVQFYNLLTLILGKTPFLSPMLNLLPQLINHSVILSVLLWPLFVLFPYLAFNDNAYVRESRRLVPTAILYIFTLHVFMVFLHSFKSPGSTVFILSLVYCMGFVAHVILSRCLDEEDEKKEKKRNRE